MKDNIDRNKIPVHVAVIMDGNGRWAKQKGKERVVGHQHGVKAVREVTEAAAELGVKYLTLFAFSTENWQRPTDEVNALMSLLVTTLNAEISTLMENNIKLQTIGDLTIMPGQVRKKLMKTIDQTAANNGMTLILALSYSARWEITNAAREIARNVLDGKLDVDRIDKNLFSEYLQTKNIPDPDILVRTSGEYRISNFLLWQIAYTELYFTKKLWPDIRKQDLYEAIIDYQRRERRFGRINEQSRMNVDR
ncbi:MAG TPA: isoprenyl transferase [Bacteroidetes bacterium]|nr:isoprenyl transferase [Bacteroidota bacterium]